MWLINGMREEFSIRLLPVSIRNVTRWMLCIRLLQRIRPIRQNPDSDYGWEKLFSERMYMAYYRNKGGWMYVLPVSIIFSVEGTWEADVRSRRPLCRKVTETPDGGTIEMWGTAIRPVRFLYIDECLEGVRRLMSQDAFMGPVNIGSDEMISINGLAEMVMEIAGRI